MNKTLKLIFTFIILGVTFKDTRWGQNYAPYDRSFVIEESTLFKIRDALKGQL